MLRFQIKFLTKFGIIFNAFSTMGYHIYSLFLPLVDVPTALFQLNDGFKLIEGLETVLNNYQLFFFFYHRNEYTVKFNTKQTYIML